ncbi:hypothetical protein C8R34_1331 [Nitrosomonas sp. Nm84]|uniref:hypothetical protein n=1 Tax=Nitrosomonas sp. Nm84 TaxID=200124 RepID=UPI000D76A9BB|nr:hypothetical protein [Nitrosomonas sp. Nm84]PXW82276.1 hypothetical protein C8R34_1331 [Nitrosomonas sp. Nm84]
MATQDDGHGNTGDKVDFSLTGNGYFINSTIITRDDGLSNYMSLNGKSKQLGGALISVLAEVAVKLNDGVPESCLTPDGDQGVVAELVKSKGIIQLKKSGDQLFTEATALSLCISLKCFDEDGKTKEGCTFQPSATTKITGGTGKFSCASGHLKDTHTRTVLAINPKGEPFGSVSGYSGRGTVYTSNSCDK